MPSGYVAGTPAALLIDVGVLYFDKQGGDGNPTRFGVSVGGLTFEPGVEYRQPEFDGKRSDIEGLDRITNRTGKISGTILMELPKHIPLIEPGSTLTAGSSPETAVWTPKAASVLLTPDVDYLTNVMLLWTKSDGTLCGVKMARALAKFTQLAGADKDEGKVQFSIEARLENGAAASSTDTAPYVYVEQSAVS